MSLPWPNWTEAEWRRRLGMSDVAKGGPGSGDRPGHDFRGNQYTGGRGGAIAAAPMTRQAFQNFVWERGYRSMTAAQLPDEVQADLRPKDPQRPLSASAVAGIDQGLRDIAEQSPVFHQFLQEAVFVYAEYDSDTAMMAIGEGGKNYILVNTEKASFDPSYTVAGRRAAAFSGDEQIRETYRGALAHEAGHVADHLTNGALTALTAETLVMSGLTTERATKAYLTRHLSPYAAESGPSETGAEVFAAVMLRQPLPAKLDSMREMIEGLGPYLETIRASHR
jgi:hypothetical protein